LQSASVSTSNSTSNSQPLQHSSHGKQTQVASRDWSIKEQSHVRSQDIGFQRNNVISARTSGSHDGCMSVHDQQPISLVHNQYTCEQVDKTRDTLSHVDTDHVLVRNITHVVSSTIESVVNWLTRLRSVVEYDITGFKYNIKWY